MTVLFIVTCSWGAEVGGLDTSTCGDQPTPPMAHVLPFVPMPPDLPTNCWIGVWFLS